MHPLAMTLLRIVYPLPESNLKRDRPMQVLALGISRSGTESLRNALAQLGYDDVFHGFRFVVDTSATLQWIQLVQAQQAGDSKDLTTADFDRILGDCEAVTDTPCCGFGLELLTAYSEAKVILNYREDLEKWHASAKNTLEKFADRPNFYEWLLTFFQPESFWQIHVMFYWDWQRPFQQDFEANGRKWYREHYRSLDERLQKEGRPYLKWKVEDGWYVQRYARRRRSSNMLTRDACRAPLCNFLVKPVPDSEFPSGNTPKEYDVKIARIFAQRKQEAQRNFIVFCAALAAALVAMVAYLIM